MSDEGGRRPKRRCARSRFASTSIPSAVHYVGYVEDDETPEMIMAKFAELERIQKGAEEKAKQAATEAAPAEAGSSEQQAAGAGAAAAEPAGAQEQALTDEQLMEVFKQTSMFNVKTALDDNQMLMAFDDLMDATEERYGDDDDLSDGDDFLKAFWSDDDEDDLFLEGDEEEEGGRGRRGGGSRRAARVGGAARLQRNAAGVKARHNVVTTFNAATQALIRRKVKVADRDEILQLRIPPPPIPLAWGRTVQPYVPEALRAERKMAVPCVGEGSDAERAVQYHEVRDVAAAAGAAREGAGGAAVAAGAPFQAALISPAWEEEAGGAEPLKRLSKLALPKLVPTGFVFIWVPKEHIHAVCRQMNNWGYIYVENLNWVYLAPNSSILTLPSPLVRTSHLTLFIFRKEGEGKDIELRHQRNPDVTFDCIAREPSGASSVPEEAFVAIETLLPTGKGKFLELWAPRGVRRPGWTHVVEVGGPES